MLLIALVGVSTILLVVVDGPHEKVNKIIYWVILNWPGEVVFSTMLVITQ